MDDFQLGIFRAAIGTHTTDKAKREFMLSLYDARGDIINRYPINASKAILELNILLLKTDKIYNIPMPDYYKATIWKLKQL